MRLNEASAAAPAPTASTCRHRYARYGRRISSELVVDERVDARHSEQRRDGEEGERPRPDRAWPPFEARPSAPRRYVAERRLVAVQDLLRVRHRPDDQERREQEEPALGPHAHRGEVESRGA